MFKFKKESSKTLFFVIGFVLIIILGQALTHYLRLHAKEKLDKDAGLKLEAVSNYLEGAIKETGLIAKVISKSNSVLRLSLDKSYENLRAVNQKLDEYCLALEESVCYVMDDTGRVIATSNRNAPDSFLGKIYVFRPYFKEAMKGEVSSYWAYGITSKKRGYYSGSPIRKEDGQVIGVAVVKKELDFLKKYFSSVPYLFLVSPEGVIFLSNHHQDAFKTTRSLSEEAKQRVYESKQFGKGPFLPLFKQEPINGSKIKFRNHKFYVKKKLLLPNGWHFIYFASPEIVNLYSFVGYAITFFILLIAGFVFAFHLLFKRTKETACRRNEDG